MTINEQQRYFGDVNRIANNMKDISAELKELIALLQDPVSMTKTKPTTDNKENEHGGND